MTVRASSHRTTGLREHLDLGRGTSGPRLSALLLIGVLLLQLVMIGSYVGALHEPRPRDVPLAVAGPAATAGLTASLRRGGVLDARRMDSVAAARTAIDERRVSGIFIPGRKRDRLLVASAASFSVAEILPVILRRAAPPGRDLTVQDVKPLPSDDPRGLSPFYLVIGWLVGGYVAATVLGLARGSAARGRRGAAGRLAALAAYALASGLLGTLLVQSVVGVLEGETLALAAAGTLLVFAVGAATAALQGLLGIVGTAVAILLFVALGNPASGGPLATELIMPGPWREIGPLLPPGAGTTLTRNIAYFDGNASLGAITVLGVYALLGSLVVLLIAGRREPRSLAEPEVAAGASFAA